LFKSSEFLKAQRVRTLGHRQELLHDSILVALVLEHINIGSEVVLEEVKALSRLKARISQNVNGAFVSSQELKGDRWR